MTLETQSEHSSGAQFCSELALFSCGVRFCGEVLACFTFRALSIHVVFLSELCAVSGVCMNLRIRTFVLIGTRPTLVHLILQ